MEAAGGHHDSAAGLVAERLKGRLLNAAVDAQQDVLARFGRFLDDVAQHFSGLIDDLYGASLLASQLLFCESLDAAAPDPVGFVVAGRRQRAELIRGRVGDVADHVGRRRAERVDTRRTVVERHARDRADLCLEVRSV